MADVKPADANGDGVVTPRERRQHRQRVQERRARQAANGVGGTGLAEDSLNMQQLAEKSGYAASFLMAYPEVAELVRNSDLDSEQGQANFLRDFYESNFYKTNGKYLSTFILNKSKGGKEWDDFRAGAREAVQAEAVRIGAVLDNDSLEFFTDQYLANGWNEDGRQSMLTKALTGNLEGFDSSFIKFGKGGPQQIMTALRESARANGVQFSEDYYKSAASAVLAGLGTIQDYDAEIRQTAAGYLPQYGDRVMAGENLRDIMSPYIQTYAKMFDLDPNSVELSDPNLRSAFNGLDSKGNPVPVGLWDFEKQLRQSDGWQYTREAHDKVSSIVGKIGAMMGFGGSY